MTYSVDRLQKGVTKDVEVVAGLVIEHHHTSYPRRRGRRGDPLRLNEKSLSPTETLKTGRSSAVMFLGMRNPWYFSLYAAPLIWP